MGKVLVIAEKPSVAQDIAKTLKCGKKGDGFLFSDGYIVSWAVGHLVELCEPDEYDEKYKKWRFDVLPIIPEKIKLKPVAKTKKQLDVLKKLMNDKETDSLICATDSGREGELIFRYIYDVTKCKKPFKRLWISSMTDAAIRDGFANMKDGREYDNLYSSAKCRSEADWLVGINASRAFTLKYDALLSIGRVQTPTLALLAEKQREINSFVSKDYWEVTAFFKTPEGEGYKGKWFDPDKKENASRIDESGKADAIAEKVKNQAGSVFSVDKELKKQPPPLLYDLTELQRDCNKKFGYPASKTLEIAQDLYEKRKMITYPRTDSRYLSSDMPGKIKGALEKLAKIEDYRQFAERTLGLVTLPLSKRIIDNSKITDHHAIIPTDGRLDETNLTKEERNVFGLIAKRFLCVFYPNYEYHITKIVTDVLGEKFMTKGTTVSVLGWMELYRDALAENGENKEKKDKGGKEKESDEDENMPLPSVVKGCPVDVTDAVSEKKQTKPPAPYTEASLLSAMENAGRFIEDEALKEQMKESGLGTPATRAAIFERLLKVGYVERKGKALVPTEKGMKLIEIVPHELKSPETTGKWEKGLSSIARGKMDYVKFMGSINRYVNYIVEEARKSDSGVVFPKEAQTGAGANAARGKGSKKPNVLGACPVCGIGNVLENTKAYYCSRWKEGCKATIWKNALERQGFALSEEIIVKLLAVKKIENVEITVPQTGEKRVADLIVNTDASAIIELANVRAK